MGRKKAVVETVEVPVAELEGVALDWAVARAEEESEVHFEWHDESGHKRLIYHWNDYSLDSGFAQSEIYEPSVNWAQGGPLIAMYNLDFAQYPAGVEAFSPVLTPGSKGGTHLIAACRAIVASVLGDTVSVPKELMQ